MKIKPLHLIFLILLSNEAFAQLGINNHRYQGKHKNYEDNWKIVAPFVNFKIISPNQRFFTL